MIALYSYYDHGDDHEGYLAPLGEHALDSSCLTRAATWDSFVDTLDQYPQSAGTPPYATEMNDEPNT